MFQWNIKINYSTKSIPSMYVGYYKVKIIATMCQKVKILTKRKNHSKHLGYTQKKVKIYPNYGRYW